MSVTNKMWCLPALTKYFDKEAVSLFLVAAVLWVLVFYVTCIVLCGPNYTQDAST